MLNNVKIWLGLIALAREIIRYLREKKPCPEKVKDTTKALQEKNSKNLKDLINEIF